MCIYLNTEHSWESQTLHYGTLCFFTIHRKGENSMKIFKICSVYEQDVVIERTCNKQCWTVTVKSESERGSQS